MNFVKRFEEQYRVINKTMESKNVIVLDPKKEYEKLAESLGGKVVTINPNDSGVFNPFMLATENVLTLDEKENELRKLFGVSDFGVKYARELLKDMSFLDDDPEWKERVTVILKEYAKI
ncbi:MAG: hypothetical protein ACK5MV_12830 [Aminipila sp.]